MQPTSVIRFFLLFLILPSFVLGQKKGDEIDYTLFLVGDSGEPSIINQPLGSVLREQIRKSGNNSTLLYLGDNIYPKGMPDEGHKGREVSESILKAQTDWIRGLDAKGIFIPGNHDWQRGNRKGISFIDNQQQWIDSLNDKNITLLPRDGCPGPVEIQLTDNSVLVILDTQWFLHPWEKPDEESDCDAKTAADAWILLSDIFTRNENKRVILAGHHPVISYGEHGGFFEFKDHIFPLAIIKPNLYFPLPLIGSIYPLYRKWFGNIQDLHHPVYKEMSNVIQNLMAENPGSIYVAGHEHALQYLIKDSSHLVVSGSGSKTTLVRKKKYTKYAEAVNGFVKLDIHKDGSVSVQFWRADEEYPQGRQTYSNYVPPHSRLVQEATETVSDFAGKTVRVHASSQYEAGKRKKRILGDNYRDAWAQEIDVPVIDLGTERGGLTIIQKGGGMQTLSLRLADSTGREFVLRSVEKYPENAVPEMFRKTFAQDLVQDQISASHPYSAIIIPKLANAAGIYHTNPKLVYIPDDPRLGIYKKAFANSLALYEERPADDWSNASFFGQSEDIISTSKVLKKIRKDNDNSVDQLFVVRSRIFDMWIGDWDRHDDQWRWASFKEKKKEVYRPIPRDRDQAFFVNEGALPKLASRKWALPKLEGFSGDIRWPSGLSYNARYFDRTFMTEPSEDDWIAIARELQEKLTDEVIEESVKQWPPEIFALHGEQVIKKLKQRRLKLVTYAVQHYQFLARAVDVLGTDKRELIKVNRLSGGDVHVKLFDIKKDGSQGQKLYDRIFRKKETKEIRIYGFGGDDKIDIQGNTKKSILVRVIGGEGADSLIDRSHVNGLRKKTLYYDRKHKNTVRHEGEVSNRTSNNPEVNSYDRRAFKYDKLAPLAYGNFNPDDGLFIGGGMLYQTEGFRKSPFKQRHLALFAFAPRTTSYNLLYRGDFTDVIGKFGLEINADMKAPNYVNNFFGLGNETVFDREIDEKPGYDLERAIDFYRFRFEEVKLEAYLTHRIGKWGMIKAGPAFQRIEVEDPGSADKYIKEFGASLPYNIFEEPRNFSGLSWKFSIDQRNSEKFTTRGVVFNLWGRNMAGADRRTADFSSYETSLSFYHSFRVPARVVFATRVGGGLNTGNYEFYQAQILGGRNELRGFRKTRFYGDSKFYTNLEMRINLLTIRTYLFPASLGILGFHDLGRVWYKDENGNDPTIPAGRSNVWHKGWGGGIWFTPFNLTVLSVEAGHSDEGVMGYIRLGFLF